MGGICLKRTMINKATLLPASLTLFFTLVVLFPACGTLVDSQGSLTLSWQAPQLNEDSSPLTDLAGYRIYFGNAPGTYNESTTILYRATTATFNDLPTGQTIYMAMTAFDYSGNESVYSNELTVTLPIVY